MKNKVATIGIIIATLILAGVAVFTAIRLYQLKQESISPAAPTSKPKAAGPVSCTALTFTLTTTAGWCEVCEGFANIKCIEGLICKNVSQNPDQGGVCVKPNESASVCSNTPTPTPTAAATPTVTPTGTPTPISTTTPTPTSTPTTTPIATSTATPTATAPPTATPRPTATEPSLPNAGTSFPTIFGIGLGFILLIGSIILVF